VAQARLPARQFAGLLWVNSAASHQPNRQRNVRFCPKADKWQTVSPRPLCAKSGPTRRSKKKPLIDRLVHAGE
jgi:hypothetical protein